MKDIVLNLTSALKKKKINALLFYNLTVEIVMV